MTVTYEQIIEFANRKVRGERLPSNWKSEVLKYFEIKLKFIKRKRATRKIPEWLLFVQLLNAWAIVSDYLQIDAPQYERKFKAIAEFLNEVEQKFEKLKEAI